VKAKILLGSIALIAGCTSRAPSPSAPAPVKAFLREGSAPGFDKRDFPGLDAMDVWMRESPYVWVGYYLTSPCFAGTAWNGQRAALEQQGWGLAAIYVGQQVPGVTPTAAAGRPAAPDCGKFPLSSSQGDADGANAVSISTADGFPVGSTIFLDVERADPMPPVMLDYVRGWTASVLARGYIAGIYAHKLNAEALARVQREAFVASGSAASPPFWVTNSVGFALGRAPSESGYNFASIWQTPADSSETWGGVTFRIDRNVASSRNPSGRP
jgi:hypothetical protein